MALAFRSEGRALRAATDAGADGTRAERGSIIRVGIVPTDGTRLPIVVSSGDFGTSSLLSSSQASTVLNRKERYTGSGPTPNEICALCERVLCHLICETSVRAI